MEKSSFSLKEIVLAALAVLSSIAVFWLWGARVGIIFGGDMRGYDALILPILGLVLAGALFALSAVFIRNAWLSYGSALLAAGVPYFLLPASNIVFGTLLLGLFLTTFAARRIRGEYALSVGFSISKIVKDGLPLYFTVASLIISVFYLQQINRQEDTFIPRPALDYTIRWLTKNPAIFDSFGLPAINSDMTIDTVLRNFLLRELEERADGKKIPEQELSRLIFEQRLVLAKQYGIDIQGSEKVGDLLSRAVQNYMERLLGPYQKYLPFAAAAAFFLAFKTVTLPLYYVTLFLTYVLIKLALYGNILKKEKEKIEVERVKLA